MLHLKTSLTPKTFNVTFRSYSEVLVIGYKKSQLICKVGIMLVVWRCSQQKNTARLVFNQVFDILIPLAAITQIMAFIDNYQTIETSRFNINGF